MKNLLLTSLALASCCLAQEESASRPVEQPDADGRVIKGRAGSKYWEPYMADADLSDYRHASPQAVEAFQDMKYGLRIHWGIYSHVHGKESWVIPQTFNNDPQVLEWYYNLYKAWYPDKFNATEWMQMAKHNQFKFFVFTTKHHDGFSLYDTRKKIVKRQVHVGPNAGQIEDCDLHYSIMETPFARDVTREIVDAGRQAGLKVGLYFSNPDWYDADFRFRKPGPDTTYTPDTQPEAFARFRARHLGQIEELLTGYGKIDLLSLDLLMTPFCWDHMQATARRIRELQPDVMVRWRGIGNFGDHQTPENVIPGDEDLGTMPWKVIHTLSKRDIFSYEPDANQLHDGHWIVATLVDVVAKGGNFMVGVGPDLSGAWHPKVLEALDCAGRWLDLNGEAIFATRPHKPYREGDDLWFTRSKAGRTVYAIRRGKSGPALNIQSVSAAAVRSVQLIGAETPLTFEAEGSGIRIEIPGDLETQINSRVHQFHVFRIQLGD